MFMQNILWLYFIIVAIVIMKHHYCDMKLHKYICLMIYFIVQIFFFTQQWYIKLIKSDSKDLYIVAKKQQQQQQQQHNTSNKCCFGFEVLSTVVSIDENNKKFLSIKSPNRMKEWFWENDMTLKTVVMIADNSALISQEYIKFLNILKYNTIIWIRNIS